MSSGAPREVSEPPQHPRGGPGASRSPTSPPSWTSRGVPEWMPQPHPPPGAPRWGSPSGWRSPGSALETLAELLGRPPGPSPRPCCVTFRPSAPPTAPTDVATGSQKPGRTVATPGGQSLAPPSVTVRVCLVEETSVFGSPQRATRQALLPQGFSPARRGCPEATCIRRSRRGGEHHPPPRARRRRQTGRLRPSRSPTCGP